MASQEEVKNEAMRQFATGATRNVDTEREDPEGFFAPSVLKAYIAYMHKNRFQKDGKLRDSDNWQLGIPQRAYMKSFWRHFFDLWTMHRKNGNHANPAEKNLPSYQDPKIIEDCCALMFNAMGYLSEELKKPVKSPIDLVRDDMGRSSQNIRRMMNEITYGRVASPMLRNQLLEDRSEPEEPGYGSGI